MHLLNRAGVGLLLRWVPREQHRFDPDRRVDIDGVYRDSGILHLVIGQGREVDREISENKDKRKQQQQQRLRLQQAGVDRPAGDGGKRNSGALPRDRRLSKRLKVTDPW